MDIITASALLTWAGLVFAFIYACRNKGVKAVIPALSGTVAGVLIISTVGTRLSESLWLWFGGITIFAILVSVFVPMARDIDPDDSSLRSKAMRAWLTLRADRRIAIVLGAFLVSLISTYFFAKLAAQEHPRSFWHGFYEAWTAGLVIFIILGLAGTLVSLYRPEKDEFSQRVRILFGGRQDSTVDFISESIRKIGYYTEVMKRKYTIKQYDVTLNAFLVRVEHESLTRNYYDDLSATDTAEWRFTPDNFSVPREPVGHLIWFKIEGDDKSGGPLPISAAGGHFKRDVNIPRGEAACVEVCSECWYLSTELHEFAPSRFAKRIEVSFVYEATAAGAPTPILSVELPTAIGPTKLEHLKPMTIPTMSNCHPGVTAFKFRLAV